MNHRVRKGAVVVTMVGVVDAVNVPLLRAELGKALGRAGSRRVVVDLSGVTLLAAAGLAVLAQAGQQALDQGGRHQSPRVAVDHNWHEPLRSILTGELGQVLTLHRGVDEALTI